MIGVGRRFCNSSIPTLVNQWFTFELECHSLLPKLSTFLEVAMKYTFFRLMPALLFTIAFNLQAHERDQKDLKVRFENCTEFVGVAPVDEAKARTLVPAPYQLVTDNAGAKLVVRLSDCQGIAVNHRPAKPGTVAHIGIMLYSPDGTATDPNTSINNYTLFYTSNLADLVKT